jgi:hypothetical protein
MVSSSWHGKNDHLPTSRLRKGGGIQKTCKEDKTSCRGGRIRRDSVGVEMVGEVVELGEVVEVVLLL